MTVDSPLGKGTSIVAEIPLSPQAYSP